MIARIEREMQRPDLIQEIGEAINDAIEYYDRRNFWFLEGSQTISVAAGTPNVPAPFLNIRLACGNGPNGEFDLCIASYDDLKQNLIGGQQGQPSQIAILGGVLHFNPVPNTAITIELTGRQKQGPLVNPTDTNAWMTEGQALIRYRALSYLYDTVLLENDRAAAFASREQDEYLQIKRESNRIQATNKIKS